MEFCNKIGQEPTSLAANGLLTRISRCGFCDRPLRCRYLRAGAPDQLVRMVNGQKVVRYAPHSFEAPPEPIGVLWDTACFGS